MSPHSTEREELLRALSTDEARGLSAEQIPALQSEHGTNRLTEKKKKTMLMEDAY